MFSVCADCQVDIHGKIREVLAEAARDGHGPAQPPPSRVDFLNALQRRGIIDDVMKDLHFTQVAGSVEISSVYSAWTKRGFHYP